MEGSLGFHPQREIVYNKFLPYAEKLDDESQRYLSEIKFQLGNAILRNAVVPEGIFWMEHLAKYIKLYGQKFSKEDHCHFIHLLLDILVIPDLALHSVQKVASVLHSLLKKIELLSRDDLQINWRPLYELSERTLYSKYEHDGLLLIPSNLDATLKSLIRSARPYFPVESTQEMLDEWRPLLCHFDIIMCKAVSYFELFLCTKLPPHQHDCGFKLWFDEFIKIWETCQNSPSWENNLLWLFARLARDNIGYINWEPYIPMIFNRLMRSFNLPGGPNNVHVARSSVTDTYPVLVLIVSIMGGGSSCQLHINRLFKALESYYHPSNTGRWMIKLQRMLHRLPMTLVKRINKERYRAPTWETPVPSKYRLTDTEITDFVICLKPVVLLAMFSKGGSVDSTVALHNLAILRPELIIPPIIERLYSSLETLTEPHRLTAAMQCMVSVARSMVQKNSHFPEGPTHVLPLLIGALPGIDPNDIRKCLSTFHFISTISTLIFFVDCSKGVDKLSNLTEVQRDLCLATAAFEDFVLQFMDRCFALIENSCLNHPSRVDRNLEHMSSEESIVEVCLASTFSTLLTNSSPAIYKSALMKLYIFVSNRIFEVKISGKNVANMCRSAAKVNPELALQQFVPHFSRLILALTESEDIVEEESLDNELLFSLLVLSEIVRCDGAYVLKYINEIEMVLKRTLHLSCRDGFYLACALLRYTLRSFTVMSSNGYSNVPDFYTRCESNDVHTLIGEWGKSGDLNNLGVKYHIPSDEELKAVERFLELFLIPELEYLQNWATGNITSTREKVQSSLNIVDACIYGAASALPLWSAEPLHLNEIPVPMQCCCVQEGGIKELSMADGKNFRLLVCEVIQQVLDHMLKTSEDDTKSLLIIIKIYNHLVFQWGIAKDDFDTKWKGFHLVKKVLDNKLYGRKQHIRALLVDRTCIQHEMRMLEKNKSCFTELHAQIMHELTKLSVSHYYDVRSKAQSVLQLFFVNYEYSYKVILPQLLQSLAKDPMQFHEEFKGALYIILSNKQNSLLTSRHWDLLSQLWPALITAKHSEKPSIIKLLDVATLNVQKYLDTIQIELKVPKHCCDQAMKLWHKSSPLPSGPCLTDNELLLASETHEKMNAIRKGIYYTLVENLVTLIETGNLHWRQYHLAFTMLLMLIRYDIRLPAPAVRIFVTHLIHDTLAVRKGAVAAVSAILKQQKHHYPLIEIDPCSPELNQHDNPFLSSLLNLEKKPSNMWLQYNSTFAPHDQTTWDEMYFVHKTHIGFYTWPKPFEVYAPDSEQPNLNRSRDELLEEECAVYDSFSQPEFVEKLISYFSIEERKGHDKFDSKRFDMFKGLFRNFGDTFLPHFIAHLRRLCSDKQESQQRCAAEIIAGLLRGSKHWNFEKMMCLKEQLVPILVVVLQNVTPETLTDWATCMATVSECRDPNKYFWLFELLMEAPPHEESRSFLESSWLFILLGALMQQEWRVCELLHRVLAYLLPRLNHPYHNVREKIGGMLSNIFMYDVPLGQEALLFTPKRSEFLKVVLPKIAILESTEPGASDNTEDVSFSGTGNHHICQNDEMSAKKKDAVNLFHTLCRWMMMSITRTHNTAPPEMFQMLPVLCSMQSDTSDSALHRDWTVTFTVLSQALLSPDSIDAVINTLKEIAQKCSWHARAAAISFLQSMVFVNLFTLMHHEPWMKEVESFILHHLHDERVEVREAAAEALSGLLHCEVLKVSDALLLAFKHKCKKLRRTGPNGKKKQGALLEPEELRERHAGILGLSACISAFPYDVPSFMPDILVFLADHLHEPPPIQTTIKKTLSNFRRTHYDSWRDHKLKFTDDQLAIITDLLVSPSYYA